MGDQIGRSNGSPPSRVIPAREGAPAEAGVRTRVPGGFISRESIVAAAWGTALTLILAALIAIGSRRLAHFDAALVGYTFATLFAVFGITYRYSMWLQRPPTAIYWKRGWQVFLTPRYLARNLRIWAHRIFATLVLNTFIWRRGRPRWLAHVLIFWGCVLAALITFPLVFGWIHFQNPEGDFTRYTAYVFGFPMGGFGVDSILGKAAFHGLVWSAFLVIPGVMLAMWRRMRDRGAQATQQFGEDFLPLILLFAISMTGLLLTASYTWMRGYAYDFLAILHAITVIFTLLYLPFGKFFHIFQRPAQLGVSFYREVAQGEEVARCARCGDGFAPKMQIDDLITVERQLGYRYEMPDHAAGHYQRICPACRRSLLAIAQGRLWAQSRGDELVAAGVPWDMASMMDTGNGDGHASVALVAQPSQTPAQAAAKAAEQARSDGRSA